MEQLDGEIQWVLTIDGPVQSDITELSTIDKTIIVVITAPAHEAFVSQVRLPLDLIIEAYKSPECIRGLRSDSPILL